MRKQQTLRDSKVSEHFDTKSVADLKSSPMHVTVILAKWRPSGKFNNRRVVEWIPPLTARFRDLVSLGDVEGGLHPTVPSSGQKSINSRSSRRGKEQMRSKTSEEVEVRLSDLTTGENPKNGARGLS